jgi:truncated hemoglobin YjbI
LPDNPGPRKKDRIAVPCRVTATAPVDVHEPRSFLPSTSFGLALAEAKSFAADFFVQVCGGPKHYLQNRGRPMLIHRHAPFKITMEGRDEWLECYRKVLPSLPIPDDLILSFWNYIDVFSVWMVNT